MAYQQQRKRKWDTYETQSIPDRMRSDKKMPGIVGLSACSLVTAGALPALPTVTFNDDTGVITFENGNTCHQGQFLGSGTYGSV